MPETNKKAAFKTVLLVEDSLGDIRLTLEAFQEINPSCKVHVVRDGKEAIAFLKREGKYAASTRPDLILLDLNLPVMGGHEFLAQIKTNETLKSIPIVILSMSSTHEDVTKSYDLQASAYLCKPIGFEMFDKLVKEINSYWLINGATTTLARAEDTEVRKHVTTRVTSVRSFLQT